MAKGCLCHFYLNSFGLVHGKRVLVSFLFKLIWASTWQKGACVIFIGMIRFSSGYCAINPSLVSRKPKVKIPCQSRIMIFLLRHAHWKICAQQLQKCPLRNETSHSFKQFSSTKHCRAETRSFLGLCAISEWQETKMALNQSADAKVIRSSRNDSQFQLLKSHLYTSTLLSCAG